MTHKVVVGFRLPAEVEREFHARLDARFLDGGLPREKSALTALLDGCAGLVVTPPIQADQWLFEHLPKSVTVVATYSVGLDHVDLKAAKRQGVAVVHTPDVLTNAVAETAFLLLLGAARRATESIELIRSGRWQGWMPRQIIGQGLDGKTLGVYGMGRIGRAIAMRSKAFGMAIAYHNTRRLPPALEAGAAYYETPEALLGLADALIIACPLTEATRGFLDARRIALMKSSAIVVNIARGDIIVDDDLIAALTTKRLFAAGLDVFAFEPKLDQRYLDLPTVFMLPHIGSSTIEARLAMGRAVIDGLIGVLDGCAPANRVV
ncbi:MAG: D-glycerate dehydrogenase [Alphaproteobacteria bacterium]|nr:D-glycerate dehydrogenase [Alphaproteobacteria bacterium]